MKTITVEIPDGFELKKEADTYRLVKEERVRSWEDLGEIDGWVIDARSNVVEDQLLAEKYNRDLWATKEQAEASIAIAQLSQLMKHTNGDWTPDWDDTDNKYILFFNGNRLLKDCYMSTQHFLSFHTEQIRDQFLEDHRELIEQAKPLL